MHRFFREGGPENLDLQFCPPAAFSSARAVLTWLKMRDFGFMPTLMTSVNIGDTRWAEFGDFWVSRFADQARVEGVWRGF